MDGNHQTQPNATVLVADDEAGVRDLLARGLGELGYKVIAVANYEEACDVLEGPEPIDVVRHWADR
jgi:CheY-like chemotaxis protein